ncbi:MAG TPA: hypothetical protein VLT47_06940 [Anaeromyxobacteraceae bacterium]|nr:hypothetical protein [Anaeromyxobacteraceae bacterium]
MSRLRIDPAHLDEAVARGTLTRAQADELLAGAEARHAALERLLRHPGLAVLAASLSLLAVLMTAPFLLGAHPTLGQRALLVTTLGFVLLALGVVIDGRAGEGFVRWLYAAALAIFRVGLAGVGGDGASAALLHLAADLGLLAAAVVLRRGAFALAGGLGVAADAGALGELAGMDGLAVGGVAGLAAAGLGALYLRHRAELERRVAGWLPAWLRHLLPGERGL